MINGSGEIMASYNKELVQCIKDLKATKEKIQVQIETEESERANLQNDLEKISNKLNHLNESLSKKIVARKEYDRLIEEAESAYSKILESSQLLLSMVKREAASLDQCSDKNDESRNKVRDSPLLHEEVAISKIHHMYNRVDL